MERQPHAEQRPAPAIDAGCACCSATTDPRALTTCPGCGRHVCSRCVRFYGHYMLMCEDCRVAEW